MNALNLCTPALVYLIISIINIVIMIRYRGFMYGISTLIFVLLWTWFLNYLCSKGHSGISWFLVALPFILAIFFGLKFYKNFTFKNSAKLDNIDYNKTLESPKDFRNAINIFLDKTDK